MTSSRHFAAVTGILFASAALIVPPAVAQAGSPVLILAESVLDTRPSAELNDEELALRIEQLRSRLQSGVPYADGVDVRPILNQDRQELRRRRGEGAARPAQMQPEPKTAEPRKAEERQVAPPKAVGDQEGKPQPEPAPQRARPDSRQGGAQERFDARPSAQLSDEELARRIEQVRARLRAGERMVGRVDLRPLINQDRLELQRRRSADRRKAEPQPVPQQPVPQQVAPQPQQPAPRRAEDKPRRPKIEFNLDLGGRRSPADEQAIDILRDRRDPARLSDADLRERIGLSRRILGDNRLDNRLRDPLQAQLDEDRDELRARLGAHPSPGGSEADRAARTFLAERRLSAALSEEELLDRVQDARGLLGNEDLSPDLFTRVRARLRDDREELRRRVAEREAEQQRRREPARERGEDRPRERDQAGAPQLYAARDLVDDRRDSRSLNDRVLQLRILSAREVLRDGRLSPRQRQRIESLLEEDRRERRARLFAERDRRRENLRQAPRSNGLHLVIPPLAATRPLPDIAAAEVDDEALERQLMAQPRERLERGYSLDDIESRSDLRGIMPGIELDTVRFGFNEYEVREEEIDKLDGIATIIERILAAQPDEVFMVEGHTDAVGSDAYNLELSRQRAEAMKQALVEYFVIDPDALVTVGYGERYLKIPTPDEEPENRRVTIRRITPLLTGRAQ